MPDEPNTTQETAATETPETPGEPNAESETPETPETPETSETPETPQEINEITDPQGYKLPKEVPDSIRQMAFDNGFSQPQLDAALQQYGNMIQTSQQAERAVMEQQGKNFVKTWGEQPEFNLSLAQRALVENDHSGKLIAMLNTTGYGNHPAVLEFLYNIGKSMKEGGYLRSGAFVPDGQKTAAQILYPDHPSKE